MYSDTKKILLTIFCHTIWFASMALVIEIDYFSNFQEKENQMNSNLIDLIEQTLRK